MSATPLKLSAWQRRAQNAVFGQPISDAAQLYLFVGGRGGGKTYAAIIAAIRYASKYGQKVLFVRRTERALADLSETIAEILTKIYGPDGFVRNRNLGEFRLPNGALIHCQQFDHMTAAARDRLQGSSYGMMVLDEAPQHPENRYLLELISNCRAPAGVPTLIIMTGNPGSPGSHWVKTMIDQGEAETVFVEKSTKLRAMWFSSTYADNEFLSSNYGDMLKAAAHDPGLHESWVLGKWTKVRGAFFSSWNPDVHIIAPWATIPAGFQTRLGLDWGSTAPAACVLIAAARYDTIGPDDRLYKAGSAIVLGEVGTNIPGSISQGDMSSPSDVAQRIHDELLSPFGLRPYQVGVMAADPQIGVRAAGRGSYTIASEFKDAGLRWRPAARENRVARLAQISNLLDGAIKADRAGLYITSAAPMLIQTLPILQRSEHRQDDVDARAAGKHWTDALSYALAQRSGGSRVVQYSGYGAKDRPPSRCALARELETAVRV